MARNYNGYLSNFIALRRLILPKKPEVKPAPLFLKYDDRFLDDHAGRIVQEPRVAIVELVANAWDAYARQVKIQLPNASTGDKFSIEDDGTGMTKDEFEARWVVISYNREANQGKYVDKPPHIKEALPRRRVFGRNGKGRHAAFLFSSNEFIVETAKDGFLTKYRVYKPLERDKPFSCEYISQEPIGTKTGTKIYSDSVVDLRVTPEEIRTEIGLRFLSDPTFKVSVNGLNVTFDDIPEDCLSVEVVRVPGVGSLEITAIDIKDADRSTKHHGIAWQVNKRLVGEISWEGFGDRKLLDGRTTEAKKYSFIVVADCLQDRVAADWQGFSLNDKSVEKAKAAAHKYIREFLLGESKEERDLITKQIVVSNSNQIIRMGPKKAEIWGQFIKRVQEECSIREEDLKRIAQILATLEASQSKLSLLEKLANLSSQDMDKLDAILDSWNIDTAKVVLDELYGRLGLIKELKKKILDERTDEVHELQPLFDRGLWIFGPEFESVSFTSNQTMNTVIKDLLKSKVEALGSRNRPDYVVLPDGSLSTHASNRFDSENFHVNGVERLLIVELKKPTIRIGADEKEQCWKYVKELLGKGQIDSRTGVTCLLLGTKIDDQEDDIVTRGTNKQCKIIPTTYETTIRMAEARTLFLYEKIKNAPFLRDSEDIDSFLQGGMVGTLGGLAMLPTGSSSPKIPPKASDAR